MKYNLVTNYRQNQELRNSFFDLTQKTFGFSLRKWYENGFWGESYQPYSLADGNRIIANVSVNRMDITLNGEEKNFLQLGTVMTDEEYRGLGLSRYLMEAVLAKDQDKCDGIYLFANDSVLDFYPKFGFIKAREYRYSKKVSSDIASYGMKKINMKQQDERTHLLQALHKPFVNNNVHMNNYCLYAFYLTDMMEDQVYYCEKEAAYAVAEIQGKTLLLHQIIADHAIDTNQIIEAFGSTINEVTLGYVPNVTEGYMVNEYREDECTLYVLGEAFDGFEKQFLRFSKLSHA